MDYQAHTKADTAWRTFGVGEQSMTNMQLASRLLSAPRRFFEDLAESPRFALPLWSIFLSSAAIAVWYYAKVDLQWFVDTQVLSSPQVARLPEAQQANLARFYTRGVVMGGALVGSIVFIFGIRLLEALYYRIAGRATGHARSYRQWFAFAWWTATPALLGIIPCVITLLFSPTNQIDPAALQPLSLNTLFFHRGPADSGYQVLSQVSVLIVASLALTVFGVRVWSKRSWLYSVVFTFLPITVIALGVASLMARR